LVVAQLLRMFAVAVIFLVRLYAPVIRQVHSLNFKEKIKLKGVYGLIMKYAS
jgi:hypothetical protein